MSLTRQEITHPIAVRARALDDAGRPRGDEVWCRETPVQGVPTPPAVVTFDHVIVGGGLVVEVSISRVTNRALRAVIDEVCPRPGARIVEAGPSLALDAWELAGPHEFAAGYQVRHWRAPRLVLQRTDSHVGGLRVLIDDGGGGGEVVPEKFAGGLAIEGAHVDLGDLWWPRDVAPPLRAYQWLAERDLPCVPA